MKTIFLIFSAIVIFFQIGFTTAGPDIIRVTGSALGNNGKYVKNGSFLDCDCWENLSLNRKLLKRSTLEWQIFEYPCIAAGMDLETLGTTSSCDPTVLSGAIEAIIAIPTISQWGLIILGIIMASFGIVAMRNRKYFINP